MNHIEWLAIIKHPKPKKPLPHGTKFWWEKIWKINVGSQLTK